jgi:hypothetical protein
MASLPANADMTGSGVTEGGFSPDGRLLIQPDHSEGPRIWRLDGEKPVAASVLPGWGEVAQGPGHLLMRRTHVLWQQVLDRFLPVTLHVGQPIEAAVFGTDGRVLVTLHEAGAVWLWPLPASADLIRRARSAATRALTRIERGELGLDDQELPAPERRPRFLSSALPDMTRPPAKPPELHDDWSVGTAPDPIAATPLALPPEYRSPQALRDHFDGSYLMYDRQSPDGRWRAMGTDDSDIWLFDMAQQPPRLLILRIDGTVNDAAVVSRLGGSLSAEVTSVSAVILDVEFSADGMWLLSGTFAADVWYLGGPAPRRINFGETERPMFRSFASPDGRRLVAGCRGGSQSLYDLTTDPPTARHLPGSRGLIDTAWFSPDGRWLLVVCSGNSVLAMMPRGRPKEVPVEPGDVRIWDLHDLDRGPAILDGHSMALEHVAFSLDGGSLLTQSEGAAMLWDLGALAPVGTRITAQQAVEWRAALKAAEATRRARSVH